MSTEKIMEQAQVFASAWSVVGGPFDGGDAMEVATQEKDELRRMVAELVEERDALAAKLKDAEHDRDEFRRVMNGFAEKMAELEGQEPVAWIYDWQAPEGLIKGWVETNRDAIPEHANNIRPIYARPVPAEPVNVDFGKRGENMFFQIGNQSFLLDYKPEEQGEFEFMKAMLLSAFSRITHGVKTESQPVNARLLDALKRLSFCAQTTGGVAGRDDELCSAIEASAKAIAEAEAQQERLLQDMHDAGREIDRVMADAKNDSYRLDALEAVAKASGTGVSFDWCRHVEDGMVVEHGYRMMWKHTIGPREKSIRHAIDAAMEVFKP